MVDSIECLQLLKCRIKKSSHQFLNYNFSQVETLAEDLQKFASIESVIDSLQSFSEMDYSFAIEP